MLKELLVKVDVFDLDGVNLAERPSYFTPSCLHSLEVKNLIEHATL